MTTRARRVVALVGLCAIIGCAPSGPASPSPAADGAAAGPASSAAASAPASGRLVLTGRIVTMDEPPIAEALFIDDGTVAAVGTRNEVRAVAGDDVPVVDLGLNVAYPGFVDAHTHWIGDRGYYGIDTAAEAIDAALRRGWTSIAEQWVNPERLAELESLASSDALPLRVDAYLALNYDREFFGDWYAEREPAAVDDHLRVRGLKIHLDDGSGKVINWEPADLTSTIIGGRTTPAGRSPSTP